MEIETSETVGEHDFQHSVFRKHAQRENYNFDGYVVDAEGKRTEQFH